MWEYSGDTLRFDIALTLVMGGAVPTLASSFKDVKDSYWGAPVIEWGVANHFISGYPDGTFKPEATVTEAEFLTMLERAYTELPSVAQPKHWADPAYNLAVKMNYPVNGSTEITKRDWPITREQVAEVIAGTQGVNYSGDYAIQYLLGKGLATGNDPNHITIESYNGKGLLKRSEAVQFIKNVKDKGTKELQARPLEPSDPKLLPPLPTPQKPPAQEPPQQTGEAPANVRPTIKEYWTSTWTPGDYTELGKMFFSGFENKGYSVSVTLNPIEGYDVGGDYWTPDGKVIEIPADGKPHILNKGKDAQITVSARPLDKADNTEGYTVFLDGSNIVGTTKWVNGKMVKNYTYFHSVLKGLGLE